jgi:hypothetical protein
MIVAPCVDTIADDAGANHKKGDDQSRDRTDRVGAGDRMPLFVRNSDTKIVGRRQ